MDEIYKMRCLDLEIEYKPNQFHKFKEHCEQQCLDRKLDLSYMTLKLNASRALSKIIGDPFT